MKRGDYSTLTGSLLGDLVVGIDHVGICVAAMDDAGAGWSSLLGTPVVDREDVVPQKTTAAFLRMDDSAAVELITPMKGNEPLGRFVEKRGDALHHIAIAVRDIHEALRRLSSAGVPLIDIEPRPGAGGHQVAFIHPKALGGVLLELVHRPDNN
jgi:methylmalonyl-CoA/ethylmalonyl-CoA epimerase